MLSGRRRFKPAFDRCEPRVVMSAGAGAGGGPATGPNQTLSNVQGQPINTTGSKGVDPLLYDFSLAYLSHAGQPQYNPLVDTNHNGIIGPPDARPLLAAVAPFTKHIPQRLTLELAPGQQANTPHPANEGGVTRQLYYATIIGHTTPNSLVFTDDTNNAFLFRGGTAIAANNQGFFSLVVPLTGPYRISQHNFLVVDPFRDILRRAFPILQLVTPPGTTSHTVGGTVPGSTSGGQTSGGVTSSGGVTTTG